MGENARRLETRPEMRQTRIMGGLGAKSEPSARGFDPFDATKDLFFGMPIPWHSPEVTQFCSPAWTLWTQTPSFRQVFFRLAKVSRYKRPGPLRVPPISSRNSLLNGFGLLFLRFGILASNIDKWVRRKLRCDLWKQWSRAGRGVSVREAWNISQSAHGRWRVSQMPALSIALPIRFFEQRGRPGCAPR